MRISDWSSDVCSSDLEPPAKRQPGLHPTRKPSTGIGGKKRLAMLCADAQTLLPQQHACKLQPVEPGRCAAARCHEPHRARWPEPQIDRNRQGFDEHMAKRPVHLQFGQQIGREWGWERVGKYV